jgi:3'-5' exoribonuclease
MKNKSPQLTQIKDFKLGKKIQGFFLCCDKSYKISKTGVPYLDILLSDNTGKVSSHLWENADHFNEKFAKGDPVAVKGLPVEFMGQLQLNINQINLAEHHKYDKYGFNPEKLIVSINENPQKIITQLETILNKINNSKLKKLCLNILNKYSDEFILYPASLNNHYPIKGGLLMHIFNCVSQSVNFIKVYTFLNNDLMISGTFLHDIGKVKSFSGEFIFEETSEVKLLGHEVLGQNILVNEINLIKNFPEELKNQLIHIVLGHHKKIIDGIRQWQRFSEALAVFNINRADAQLDIMNRVYLNLNNDNQDWTDGKHHFKTSLLKK